MIPIFPCVGSDDIGLEPAAGPAQDVRRPAVPPCRDSRGPTLPHHGVPQGVLLEPILRRSIQPASVHAEPALPLADRAAWHRVAGLQAQLRAGAEETHAEAPLRASRHALPGVPVGLASVGAYG